jgi:MerR family transcriptional regulator/heat shock protein HspR|tara:strand:+ start:2349 stop:2747 length:399 start_codon:yes stop_codon:yes gene_type:complete
MQISQPPDGTRAVYVISVAAELAGVHAQTLRIYERKGLVEPARTPGGSRRYSDIDISLLRRIQELTNEGLNLVGVKKVMDLEQRISRLETEITSLETSTEASLAEVHRQYRRDLVPLQQAPVPWLDPKRKQF